ncbi:MAG: hypothetical protein NVS4B3_13780 [Gemmatimonadaceae bacterium]
MIFPSQRGFFGSAARTTRRPPVTRVLRGALVTLFVLAMPSVAFAHGRLKSSSPAAGAHLGTAPRELRFEFSEVPDLTFSSVRLVGPDGREVVLGPLTYTTESRRVVSAAIRGALLAGTYVVQWQLAGDDAHPIRGRFDFVVAPGAMGAGLDSGATRSGTTMMPMPDSSAAGMAMHHDPASMPEGNGFGAESAGYVIVRWVQFMALLLTIGAIAFRQFVLAFLRRKEGRDSPMIEDAEHRAARVGYLTVSALGSTLVVRLLAQSYAMHGAAHAWDMGLSLQMIQKTMWGKGWLLQLVGVIVAGVGFQVAGRSRPARRAEGAATGARRSGWPLASVGAAIVAFSPAFSGHAAAAPKLQPVAVLADGLHVMAASSWLGSLALVLIAGLPAALRLAETDRGPMVAELINAFSPVALTSAALAATTGLFAAWLHVGRVPNLWGTRYGVTLLVKLTILGIVALTGFYNWRFVKPRLGTDGATVHLRRSARVEVVIAAVVLLVTAVLVATPPSMDMQM